jgi:hypothetical protein
MFVKAAISPRAVRSSKKAGKKAGKTALDNLPCSF